MLTMVYTTLFYTVVYNLFFIVVCVSACMCCFDVSSMDGCVIRGQG